MHVIFSVAQGLELKDYFNQLKNQPPDKLDLYQINQEGPYVTEHCWILSQI